MKHPSFADISGGNSACISLATFTCAMYSVVVLVVLDEVVVVLVGEVVLVVEAVPDVVLVPVGSESVVVINAFLLLNKFASRLAP